MANPPPGKPIYNIGIDPYKSKHEVLPHHLHYEEERELSVKMKPLHEIHTVEKGGMDGHIHASSCKCQPVMDGTDMRIWHHKELK